MDFMSLVIQSVQIAQAVMISMKETSRAVEIGIIVQDRTCRSLQTSLCWILGEPRWSIVDIAFKYEKPRWKSALFSLMATRDCVSFSMFLFYLEDPHEQKQIIHNRGTQGPFFCLRTRANRFSVLSPMKRNLLDSKKNHRHQQQRENNHK